ncbi:hypothetical protein [Paraburkholderia youngii]|uniref:hypothetical protein n=1 Tax=Paraburkholderia youngii TaxID=2782701 RepID=UPI003D23BDE4
MHKSPASLHEDLVFATHASYAEAHFCSALLHGMHTEVTQETKNSMKIEVLNIRDFRVGSGTRKLARTAAREAACCFLPNDEVNHEQSHHDRH